VWTVLVGTPVGKYFEEYLLTLKDKQKLQGSEEVTSLLSEQRDYMLQNGVIKLYLEDFYAFTQRLGGETAEIMGHLLSVRADQICLHIVDASFIQDFSNLSKTHMGRTERQSLLPTCGYLFPEAFMKLRDCRTLADLRDNVLKIKSAPQTSAQSGAGRVPYSGGAPYRDYHDLVARWAIDESEEGKASDSMEGLEDGFYHYNVSLLENAFYGQSHYAIFYAFVKLKEQEVRNLVWICECIAMKDARFLEKLDRYIPIFSGVKRSWAGRD
jgi:V-type H+-transporting ATPase subunit d